MLVGGQSFDLQQGLGVSTLNQNSKNNQQSNPRLTITRKTITEMRNQIDTVVNVVRKRLSPSAMQKAFELVGVSNGWPKPKENKSGIPEQAGAPKLPLTAAQRKHRYI